MASAIVPAVLTDDNYQHWSVWMRNYLVAQDLWEDIIELTVPPPNNEAQCKVWKKKNATALNAIQISCKPDILVKIDNPDSAKIAWDALANLFTKPLEQEMTSVHDEFAQFAELEHYIYRGDWNSIRNFIDRYPDVTNVVIAKNGDTALIIVAAIGREEIVGKLVDLMSPEALMKVNEDGDSALHHIARRGITKAANDMVEKNTTLVEIANHSGFLPVTSACLEGCKDMAVYLFTKTPFELLSEYENGIHGSLLLQEAIQSRMFDIALEILRLCPRLAIVKDAISYRTAFDRLPWTMDIFPSGNQLRFWERWIYCCIHVRPLVADNSGSYIVDQGACTSSTILQRVLGQLQGVCVDFLKFLGIKQIYDLKMTHACSSIIVHGICEQLSTLDIRTPVEKLSDEIGIRGVFRTAVEEGVIELVTEIIKVFPWCLMCKDDHDERSSFLLSIANHQVNIFNLFAGLTWPTSADPDKFGNTTLHLAAMLLPSTSSRLNQISGAALQMQSELQWYKEVERISHPGCKLWANDDDLTPPQLFTKHHKELLIEGEKWMKDIATSCSVVAALIITIMFTAAFTVPGGTIQDKGIPVFLDKKAFKIFVISDAVSLFASSTSVMMFLGILTSRYAEQDFLLSLPRKLIIGLSTLFISIAAMMVAFCAALIIMLHGMMELIIPIVLLACVPVTIFMFLQFPLLVEIFMSTYGPSIFKRRKEASVLNI